MKPEYQFISLNDNTIHSWVFNTDCTVMFHSLLKKSLAFDVLLHGASQVHEWGVVVSFESFRTSLLMARNYLQGDASAFKDEFEGTEWNIANEGDHTASDTALYLIGLLSGITVSSQKIIIADVPEDVCPCDICSGRSFEQLRDQEIKCMLED